MGAGGEHHNERGFALVEALASLVVVGMIALMITEGVVVGRRMWDRLDARQAADEGVDAAEAILRGRIEQVYPTTLYDVPPQDVDFHGAGDSMVFVGNPPESDRPSTLRRYSLGVDTASELVLSSVSDVDPTVTSSADRQVLLTGVRALDVAYFGPGAPNRTRQWRPSWDLQPALPELVRVRVTFEPGDPRRWPDLIARPRATIDTGCVVDVNTHHCRGRG